MACYGETFAFNVSVTDLYNKRKRNNGGGVLSEDMLQTRCNVTVKVMIMRVVVGSGGGLK